MAETIEKDTHDLRLFRDLIDGSNDAIFVAARNSGRLLEVNDKACASLGYGRDELLNMSVTDFDAFTRESSQWERHAAEVFARGQVLLESAHRRKDGTTFPVEINIKPASLGGRDYVIGIARDVTERKKAEEHIRILAGLVDIAPAAVTVVDLEGNIVYANQTALDLHGYSREEFLALNLRDIDVPESAGLIASRTQQALDEATASFEVLHYRKDRTTFPLQVFVKLAEWGGKKFLWAP